MLTNALSGHAILVVTDAAHPVYFAGVSAHGGVLVLWDKDYDERIIELIDSLTADERRELVAINETKGGVTFFWRTYIPRRLQVADVRIAHDTWQATHYVRDSLAPDFRGKSIELSPMPELAGCGAERRTAALA